MRSDHCATRTAGPDARTVTVRTPGGPVALDVGSVREAVALVLTVAQHWPQWPGPVIGPAGTDREPTETPTGTPTGSTGSPDRADREHRDTDREQSRESGREHPLPCPDRSRPTRAIPRPAA
jgi:hypothetical protein